MSTLKQFLAEHCPSGVEHAPLGEVGQLIRGRRFTKSDYVEDGLGSIHYGEVYTRYGTSTDRVHAFVRSEMKDDLRLAKTGDLVIAATGESVEEVGKAVAWLGKEDVAVHDDCYIFRHPLDAKFVAYFFQSSSFHSQKARHVTDSKLARISGAGLAAINMPVPPLPVQREVARILEEMEELNAELEGELKAELEARRSQYEHYRQVLVDGIDAEMVPLSDLGTWSGGMTPSKSNPAFWESGTIPWLASMDVSDEVAPGIRGRITELALEKTSVRLLRAPLVVVVMRSNILRRQLPVGLVEVDTTVNQDVRALMPSSGVDASYVFHALRVDRERIRRRWVRTDGSMAAVDSKGLQGWKIPLPSFDEQQRIAGELRHFDGLVNDLSADLPAEIAARRKQYEYYRDLLLTFPEKTA